MIDINPLETYVITNRFLEDYLTGEKFDKNTILRVPNWNAKQVIAGGHVRKADIQTLVNYRRQAMPNGYRGLPRKQQIKMALEAISL